ncbi:hypothetical protein GLAREA_06580 [Glarea lozoyensis ATCC 20868]|uniref:Uncharacterized protein n=1 Tax=Glarea lozoyensis (strain ATCC 20868 / MF5171) TaxID=1116229 RepID=S3D531_GLAL2|nr:uncharacterized protein GLAREA_06580 [Glarea lozoyensis ATCC 20868]EPE33567.1 hypothetical protein GLAREA_06580 [Glarea lozoyensis ATCC 20868]
MASAASQTGKARGDCTSGTDLIGRAEIGVQVLDLAFISECCGRMRSIVSQFASLGNC